MHKTIRKYTCYDSEQHLFSVPPLEQLEKCALIVTTTRSAALLTNAGVQQACAAPRVLPNFESGVMAELAAWVSA